MASQAYGEIRAKGQDINCENTARLFVDGKLVLDKPTVPMHANAGTIAPIAWSRDGRWLVIEYGEYFYASDFGGIDLFLYDAASGKVRHPNVIRSIERGHSGKRCKLDLGGVSGFDSRNQLRIYVHDYAEADGQRNSYCIDDSEEWSYDPVTGAVRRI